MLIFKNKKGSSNFFRDVHLQALIFLIFYSLISKTIFIKSISHPSLWINFLAPYFFGVFAGMVFLYLLKHEDFFHFMKDVEKREEKKEKKFLKKYLHHGKILATLIIATLGGPIFAAITIRLILPRYKYSLLLICIGNITSTIFTVGLSKGAIVILF